MQTVYRTYKIQPKDTLASIASHIGLEVGVLRDYHNDRVPTESFIVHKLPRYLKEIVLPPEGFTIREGREVWSDPDHPEPELLREPYYGWLGFTPSGNDRSYGVLKTIKNGDTETTIKYKVNLRFYPTDVDGDNYVSIDKVSSTYINDQEPDLMADELAIACFDTVYPIILKLDKYRRLESVANHVEIVARWKKTRTGDLSYFQGETAEAYFDLFEKSLMEKNLFFHKLKSDWFIATYFGNIYRTYDSKNNRTQRIDYPVVGHLSPIAYTVDQQAYQYTLNNRVKIFGKGTCTDTRSAIDIESKFYFPAVDPTASSVKGNYESAYFLKAKSHEIDFAFVQCDLELKQPKSIKITISAIAENPELQVRHSQFVMEEQTEKKSFWKSIFS